jgi:FHA domain
MAEKDDKEAGESTHVGPLRPPAPKLPPAPATPASGAADESTKTGGAPPRPPGVPPPSAPPASGETPAASPPPPAASAAPAASPPAPAASGAAEADRTGRAPVPPPKTPPAGDYLEEEEGTVLLSTASARPCSLQRLAPAGHGAAIVKLDRDSYLMGRSHTCDIQLFSATASRQHAQLLKKGDAWVLRPVEDKVVIAGGVRVKEEVCLTHKMRLQLGGDELLFFDEAVAASGPTTAIPASGDVQRRRGVRGVLVAVAVAIVVGVAAALAWHYLHQ